MNSHTVRLLTKHDFIELGDIHARCFSDFAWSSSTFEDYFILPEWTGVIGFCVEKPKKVCDLTNTLELQRRLSGFIIGRTTYDINDVFTIAVDPCDHGKGVGTALLDAYLNAISTDCMLEVAKGNVTAIHLYEKFGFEVITTRRGYYNNPDPQMRDAYVMRKKTNVFEVAAQGSL